mmetsp:Transcript_58917/g.164619  ORF Transcript_58917/g.164619 Transcript_58917/m.164619 type:complete len:207 (+) Transcript_58917:107-727(+)
MCSLWCGGEIQTSVSINANVSLVWGVLTDFADYPEWNPFITSIQVTSPGRLCRGAELCMSVCRPDDQKVFALLHKVLCVEEDSELSWGGRASKTGFHDYVHTFRLSEQRDGSTLFQQSHRVVGAGVRLTTVLSRRQRLLGLQKFSDALRKRVEGVPPDGDDSEGLWVQAMLSDKPSRLAKDPFRSSLAWQASLPIKARELRPQPPH